MITKFTSIENLAVFQNFEWDKTVLEKDGTVKEFKTINILYGRNYSGKTTLSRIVRALETGKLSDKYENPNFKVSIKDEAEITSKNLKSHGKNIRVFNEDFVRDNLKFIIDSDKNIEPFAILGEDNSKIEEEICALENELGSNDEGEETGLYKNQIDANKDFQTRQEKHTSAKNALNDQLSEKATNRKTGIKYNSDKYGNQNYDIRELEKDIKAVLKPEFLAISNEGKKKLEKLIDEKTLEPIPELYKIELNLTEYSKNAKELVEKPVSESGKIEELVKNAILNRWSKEGLKIHKGKRVNCGFCGNQISDKRWDQLEKHFDEESEKLENDIDNILEEVEEEKKLVKGSFKPLKNLFYTSFHSEIDIQIDNHSKASSSYISELDGLTKQLKKRKNDLINPFSFEDPNDYSSKVLSVWDEYEQIRTDADSFTTTLDKKQKGAKDSLRLREVSDFLTTIKYSDQQAEINKLAIKVEDAKKASQEIATRVKSLELAVESKKRELNDEEKGAIKVNEYLNDYFGHGSLSLQAIEDKEDEEKQIRFQVIRDGKKAHHLSEGECSLLAFCYFVAKLEDIDTKGSKSIIWIDDPVSSLDGNHVFFVYSLLKAEIVDAAIFEQLFVSTHNLDFLKYLKRLNGGIKPPNSKFQEFQRAFFIVNRVDKVAELLPMPKYLKEYITEFNFLFEQVYKCSEIETVNDTNYTLFYNFGNNARKFLEIYLYYKFPDASKDIEKHKRFFGPDPVPAILTDRINNEYSHLCGIFERGSTPVEVPEMKKTANLIISKLKKDNQQYESLLRSIGIEKKETESK